MKEAKKSGKSLVFDQTPRARLYNLPTMATMVGGTLLFEGAHLIDAIRTFAAKQANVVITPLFFGKPKTKQNPQMCPLLHLT